MGEAHCNFRRARRVLGADMKFLTLLLWAFLLVLCWPLALLLLVLWPVLWVLSIPFRIAGIALEALLSLVKAILFLPARILGAGR